MSEEPVRHKLKTKDQQVLDSLNERQRTYLGIAYGRDQSAEAAARDHYHRHGFSPKADEYRWLGFNSAGGMWEEVPKHLYDSGAGSTWASLAERGLLTERHVPGFLHDILQVRLTTQGRRVGAFCELVRENRWDAWRTALETRKEERRAAIAAAPRIELPADVLAMFQKCRYLFHAVSVPPATSMDFEELLERATPGPPVLVSASYPNPLDPNQADQAAKDQAARDRRQRRAERQRKGTR